MGKETRLSDGISGYNLTEGVPNGECRFTKENGSSVSGRHFNKALLDTD